MGEVRWGGDGGGGLEEKLECCNVMVSNVHDFGTKTR